LLIVIFYLVELSQGRNYSLWCNDYEKEFEKKITKNDAKFESLNINWFLGGKNIE